MKLIHNYDREYDLVGNGVAYGYLPKVGNSGLLIIRKLYDGKWNFNFDKATQDFIGEADIWFQVWDGKDLEWFHGSVNRDGKITQIG